MVVIFSVCKAAASLRFFFSTWRTTDLILLTPAVLAAHVMCSLFPSTFLKLRKGGWGSSATGMQGIQVTLNSVCLLKQHSLFLRKRRMDTPPLYPYKCVRPDPTYAAFRFGLILFMNSYKSSCNICRVCNKGWIRIHSWLLLNTRCSYQDSYYS